MAAQHRSRTQYKNERNETQREKRPHAKLSYARIPVQKACIVMDAIRGKDLNSALAMLEYSPKHASAVIRKLVASAAANAEFQGMNRDHLYIAECFASNGPIMKRIQPRARGSAYRINKRMSHLTVILDEKGGR